MQSGPIRRSTARAASGRRDDDRAACRRGEERRVEHLGGALPPLRAPAAHHGGGELDLPAAPSQPHHPGGDLEHVPRPHRREELHVGVRREQALVAVRPDAQLRRDVAEAAEAVGAVDEVPGVVGVGVGDVPAVRDGEAEPGVGRLIAGPGGLVGLGPEAFREEPREPAGGTRAWTR